MQRPSEVRRAQAAANTHAAIVDAAQALFAERGYVATTIDQVARLADVSPATVYAVAGGKRGLIASLVKRWAESPVLSDGLRDIPTFEDAYELVRYIAHANRRIREQHADIIRILLATAASNAEIAAELESATARYRSTIALIARRLVELGVEGETSWVADVMWFYFGYSGYFTLVEDNGWSFEQAEQWLTRQCAAALGIVAAP